MANNTISLFSHTVIVAEEGLVVLDSNNSVMGVAMYTAEVEEIIFHH